MPGPGHPGHGFRPPEPVRPAEAGRSGTTGAPPAPGGGATPESSAQAGPEEATVDAALDASGAESLRERAAEATAALADMLVEEAEEAVEEDIGDLEDDIREIAQVAAARDEYLDRLQRLQADFENYKKRVQRQQADLQERAAEALVVKLLPVLDNFDLAMAHGGDGLEPVYRSLLDVLEAAGLERVDPGGQPFDPNEHDAVLHEEGGDALVPEVIEVLRAGYRWKGRVLRPAMVKVKG